TLAASVGVEEGPEAGLGRERALEDLLPPVEAVELLGGKAAQRITRLERRRARGRRYERVDRGERDECPARGPHGFLPAAERRTSTPVAVAPVGAVSQAMRHTVPGTRAATPTSAEPALTLRSAAKRMRWTRTECPTPVRSSSVPAWESM